MLLKGQFVVQSALLDRSMRLLYALQYKKAVG